MKQLLLAPFLLLGLLVSNTASAAMMDIFDGFFTTYNPNDTYGGEIDLIEGDIYSFGFDFIAEEYEFILTFDLPTDFVGVLDFGVSSVPDATCQGFGGGSLTAGQSTDISVGGV